MESLKTKEGLSYKSLSLALIIILILREYQSRPKKLLPVNVPLFSCEMATRPICNSSDTTSERMGGKALQKRCKQPRAGTKNWFRLAIGRAHNRSDICCTTYLHIEKDFGIGYWMAKNEINCTANN